jgi:hypothetical protein
MKNRKTIVAVLIAVVATGSTALAEGGGAKEGEYLTKDGKLAVAFSLKNTQGGFAGFTGNLYVIHPDGKWTITRVFNRRKFKPHACGKLSETQLQVFTAALKRNRVDKLPSLSGGRAQANPLVITVTFGKHRSVCSLPAGLTDPRKLPKGPAGDVGRRVMDLRKTVKGLLVVKKRKPKS